MKYGLYKAVKPPSDYPGKIYRKGYVLEHHLVYWENTGQVAKSDEVIHHINGDVLDNSISNLQVMPRNEHSKLHCKPRKTIELICAFCGNVVLKNLNEVKAKRKKGQVDFYCNRPCMVKDFWARKKLREAIHNSNSNSG